jgi:von Willebrand factor type A domain-containing protein
MPVVPARLALLVCPIGLLACGFTPGAAGSGLESSGSSGSGGSGSTANSSGLTGIGATNGGDVGVGTGGTGADCGQMNVPITPLPPDILIVQDRSGSMDDDGNDRPCNNNNGGCGSTSKWAQVTAAINAVVMQTQSTVNWGLKFFADSDNVCGVSPNTVAVAVAPNNATPIAAAITASTSANGGVLNGSSTPTEQAVRAGITYLQSLTDTNPKYILLATDGLPNCVPNQRATTGDNSAGAEAAVSDAKTAGFPTFVVGIATDRDAMATDTLNTMAMDGGEAQANAATAYYSVADTATLEAALQTIVGITASCTISLSGAPTGFTNVAISANDSSGNTVEIPQDAQNGWSYGSNMTTVVLNGTSCTNLQNGSYSNFQFYYACAGQEIKIGAAVAQ